MDSAKLVNLRVFPKIEGVPVSGSSPGVDKRQLNWKVEVAMKLYSHIV